MVKKFGVKSIFVALVAWLAFVEIKLPQVYRLRVGTTGQGIKLI